MYKQIFGNEKNTFNLLEPSVLREFYTTYVGGVLDLSKTYSYWLTGCVCSDKENKHLGKHFVTYTHVCTSFC